MKITIDVPDENINGALAAPASRYWALEASWDPATKRGNVVDAFDGSTHELNEVSLRAALLIMAVTAPTHLVALASGSYDGSVGDVLLQLTAFGELRYG